MTYSSAGRIEHKSLTGNALAQLNFSNYYHYYGSNPYAVTDLDGTNPLKMIWDRAGNLCFETGDMGTKFFTWTEDNRMQGFYHDKGQIAALYRYDASGERELKLTATVQDVWTQNAGYQKQPVFDDATLYAGPLMTVSYNRDAARYVKHYFAGTERILANVAGGGHPAVPVDMELKVLDGGQARDDANRYADFVTYYFNSTANKYGCEDNKIIYDAKIEMPPLSRIFKEVFTLNAEDKLYYFNANHLGSGSLITDGNGKTYQTIIYAPFGEILHNKFAGDYDEPYKFTGYERDQESGLNYAHARSQDVNLGFISTEPKWRDYPSISSYAYCANDPINKVDPDGQKIVLIINRKHYTYTPGSMTVTGKDGKQYSLSETGKAYKIVKAYNDVYNSGDKVLKDKVQKISDSNNIHYIDDEVPAGQASGSHVAAGDHWTSQSDIDKIVEEGKGIGSWAYFNLSKEELQRLKNSEGVDFKYSEIVAHELQHQYDCDTGNMKDSHKLESNAKSPAEKRGVNNENRMRKVNKSEKRTTYGGEKIKGLD